MEIGEMSELVDCSQRPRQPKSAGQVSAPALQAFFAQAFFGLSDKKGTSIPVARRSEAFVDRIVHKTEYHILSATYQFFRLRADEQSDIAFARTCGPAAAPVPIGHIAYLLEQRQKGEPVRLLDSRGCNRALVLDVNDVPGYLVFYWSSTIKGWCFDIDPVDEQRNWRGGDQIISACPLVE